MELTPRGNSYVTVASHHLVKKQDSTLIPGSRSLPPSSLSCVFSASQGSHSSPWRSKTKHCLWPLSCRWSLKTNHSLDSLLGPHRPPLSSARLCLAPRTRPDSQPTLLQWCPMSLLTSALPHLNTPPLHHLSAVRPARMHLTRLSKSHLSPEAFPDTFYSVQFLQSYVHHT